MLVLQSAPVYVLEMASLYGPSRALALTLAPTLALGACARAPGEPAAQPPRESPNDASAVAFEAVMPLHTWDDPNPEGDDGPLWSLWIPIAWSQEARERAFEAGVLDDPVFSPADVGLVPPLAIGDEVRIVSEQGVLSRRVTGYSIASMMYDDLLIVHIGPAEQGPALAVFGPNGPAPSAALRALPEHPVPPELLARLAESFDAASDSLLAELAQSELYEASSDPPIDIAARRPEPSCVSLRRPALARAAAAVAVVRCGEAPQLSALLLVEADALVPLGGHADWSLVAEAELLAAVDLDGDGIDELLIANSSIEWYELQTLRWDGAAYQRVPELPPITPPPHG